MTRPAPTDEQVVVLDAFATGGGVKVEAGAGTGKTSTIVEVAHSPRGQTGRGQYVAFNKGIVTEAGSALPGNVAANTAHSLAFRVVGRDFAPRLRAGRMRSADIAKAVGIRSGLRLGDRYLGAGLLASIASRAVVRFCQTADAALTERHVPYQEGLDVGDSFEHNGALREFILPFAEKVWQDAIDMRGRLPYKHDYYLKLWERTGPVIAADFILFDEAQDASPVLLSAIRQQTHAQVVWVGDSNQQIYAFTGAVNALAGVEGASCWLTQSFRFGQPVADVANEVLATLPTELRLRGNPALTSVVGPVAAPNAVLTRTNAAGMREYLGWRARGKRPHLVGGGNEIVTFARAAMDLRDQGWTTHADLACFKGWDEVLAYVEQDAQGDELRLLVKLVEDFGPETLIVELNHMIPEAKADVVISTAHKAKGLAWGAVALMGDFPPFDKRGDDENRLLYVAATRARTALDLGDNTTRPVRA